MSSKNSSVPNNFNERFTYVIEILKKKEGLTQKKIADVIGISAAALSDLMTGKSKSAKTGTLTALDSEFSIDINWLLKKEGTPFKESTSLLNHASPNPDKMDDAKHMKELLSEKNEKIAILQHQVKGLEADKEELKADKAELRVQISELKKEMAGLVERQTGS